MAQLSDDRIADALAPWRGRRYVALGSSFASGPGIPPRAPGSVRAAGRSARNYPHLVAGAAGLRLTDVTSSGATCAHILHERQYGSPPQRTAVTSDTDLVTVTIGGNDIGLTAFLIARRMPSPIRLLPAARRSADEAATGRALGGLDERLHRVFGTVRQQAPNARLLVVNYLSVLGPARPGESATDRHYRYLAEALANRTATVAERVGAHLVDVRTPSLAHAPGSAVPWTQDFFLPVPGRPPHGTPCHPTAAGMAAVADLVLARLRTLAPVS
ncbi:SGNH/GDSL hydrolase family protein [Nocardia sp. NPDC050697]|uniref:SGNH/GDSL hydrolase family protein n=1 Tax=Nocardia sp. NPDC050697 TaxID=3155158 RepID=UPI0033EAE312